MPLVFKPEAQGVVVCFGFSTLWFTLTMSTREVKERTLYEQRRRKNVIRESREFRVMERWLAKMYPTIANEFKLFHTKLQKQNPSKRDLTTTEDFLCFVRLGDGTLCVFSQFDTMARCLRYIMLCFLETECFSLKVPLFTQPRIRQSASPNHSEDATSQVKSPNITGEDVKPCVV